MARHQFYLHAKLDLQEGRLKVEAVDTASKLVALIAQAESGDLEPESPPVCLYTQLCQLLLNNISQESLETVIRLHRDMRVSTIYIILFLNMNCVIVRKLPTKTLKKVLVHNFQSLIVLVRQHKLIITRYLVGLRFIT